MTAPADDIRRTVDALMEQAVSANEDVSTEQMMARAVQAERDRCARIVARHQIGATNSKLASLPTYVVVEDYGMCLSFVRNGLEAVSL